MAAPGWDGFDLWLSDKLQSLSSDIDTDVFVTYIIGILDTDSQEEENEENITELLSGVVDPDIAVTASRSIVSHWNVHLDSKKVSRVTEDVADRLSMIFEQQTLATVKEKQLSKEDADRKAAILAQYGEVSDGEETDPEELSADESSTPTNASTSAAKVKGDTNDSLLMRNVNKEEVMRLEREKRDKAKEEQEKKKEKDKQDRIAQKQKQQERKETEKKRTQKGEKRR